MSNIHFKTNSGISHWYNKIAFMCVIDLQAFNRVRLCVVNEKWNVKLLKERNFNPKTIIDYWNHYEKEHQKYHVYKSKQ